MNKNNDLLFSISCHKFAEVDYKPCLWCGEGEVKYPRLSLGKYGTNFATNRHKDKLETTGVDIVQLLLLVSSISDYFTSKCLQLVHSQLPKRILRMIELYLPRELLEPEQRCVNYSDSNRKHFKHQQIFKNKRISSELFKKF